MRAAGLVLVLLLTACGQQSAAPGGDALRPADGGPTPASPAAADGEPATAQLARVAEVARAEGSVRYTGVVQSSLDGAAPEVDARMSGVLDTAAGAGTAAVELLALGELADGAPAGEEAAVAALDALAEVRLSWDPEQVTFEAGGHRESVPRDPDDDQDGGLLERVPDEPAAVLEMVAGASDAQVVGREQVDGVPTTHLRVAADARQAVRAGVGTQAPQALAALPALAVEVWLDGAGRPLRIRYRADVPSLQQGRTRALVTTYDYRDWGRPVDLPR